jgi:hypothetical protein
VLLGLLIPCTLLHLTGLEHGRAIPSADIASARIAANSAPGSRVFSDVRWCLGTAKEKASRWTRMVGRGSRLNRSSDPKAECVELDIGMAPEADGRADELALVAPGTAADDTKAWIAAPEPR